MWCWQSSKNSSRFSESEKKLTQPHRNLWRSDEGIRAPIDAQRWNYELEYESWFEQSGFLWLPKNRNCHAGAIEVQGGVTPFA